MLQSRYNVLQAERDEVSMKYSVLQQTLTQGHEQLQTNHKTLDGAACEDASMLEQQEDAGVWYCGRCWHAWERWRV